MTFIKYYIFKLYSLLLPLPIYWDKLTKINWELIDADDGREYSNNFQKEAIKYLKARAIAFHSIRHEKLFFEFLESDEAASIKRPRWI